MSYFITAILAFIVGMLLTAFLFGAKKRDDDLFAASNELDAARIEFMGDMQGQVLYNESLKSWGFLQNNGLFLAAAPTLRATIDKARSKREMASSLADNAKQAFAKLS
jgi:hypothetical protein